MRTIPYLHVLARDMFVRRAGRIYARLKKVDKVYVVDSSLGPSDRLFFLDLAR